MIILEAPNVQAELSALGTGVPAMDLHTTDSQNVTSPEHKVLIQNSNFSLTDYFKVW